MATKSKTLLKTDLGTLQRCCGVSWLEACEEGSVDLVVADPPYNLGKSSWDKFDSPEDYLAWTRRWVEAARLALKPTGSLYLMGFSEVLAQIMRDERLMSFLAK